MRALITGITGFVGSHLAEHLLSKGYEVHGMIRWRSKTENIDHIKKQLKLHETDLRDAHSVERAIVASDPDEIYHLAGQSYVPASWDYPENTMTINVIGTINLLESVRRLDKDPRIQLAGSSEEYGFVHPNEIPIKETNQLRPLSPYGISKVAEDMLAFQYHRSYGIKVLTTRAFNHEGPRRGDVFVTSNFARQIAMIEKGKQEPIVHVGNLEAKRDYTDVRDMVKAYNLSLQKCDFGETYNICSGKAWSIQQVLDMLIKNSTVKVKVQQDKDRMRPSDVPLLLGDSTKFRQKTGWAPTIPFEKTMEDLLNYWRERV